MTTPSREVIVLGAGEPTYLLIGRDILEQTKMMTGVIGLTTALKIHEKGGYNVKIVAELFHTDPKSPRYTSHWAVSDLSALQRPQSR